MYRSIEYYQDLVRSLAALPTEVEWSEFKVNNKDPERIAKYISAISNVATLYDRPYGYIVWGKTFIRLWAGVDYSRSYYIALLFFVALYVPLIQNIGITILQARNQMKFRSLLYIFIAAVALILQIVFAKIWGEIGCAIAIAGALFVGQGLVMNYYYFKVQKLDILSFWKEILRMDLAPIILAVLFSVISRLVSIDSWPTLIMWIIIYSVCSCFVLYNYCINSSEKELILSMIGRIKWRR